MKTIVVIPTYNESENLSSIVDAIFGLGIEGIEVLVVDDNSPDGTGQLAEDLAKLYAGRVHVIHRPGKMGLGSAYITGFRYALDHGADYIIEMDADFSHSPSYLLDFMEKIQDHDVVIGSRYVQGGGVDAKWGLTRRVLSLGGSIYARLILGLKVHDVTGGFKCFRRSALEGFDLDKVQSQGFAFQIEMNYACHRKGYRMAEIPIVFPDRVRGKSKMSSKIALEAAWRVWQIKWRY